MKIRKNKRVRISFFKAVLSPLAEAFKAGL